MNPKVNSLKVLSHGENNRTATIQIETGWTSMRADINDLPQDMYETLKDWVNGRKP